MKKILLLSLLVVCVGCEQTPTSPTVININNNQNQVQNPTPTDPSDGVDGNTGGSANRVPDPPPGQSLAVPAYAEGVTRAFAAQNANLLQNSCQDSSGDAAWAFMDGVVSALRARDTRWGYVCKFNNCSDPSRDVIAYHAATGPDVAGASGTIGIDIIGDHCGEAPVVQWTVFAFDPGGLFTPRRGL